MGALAVNKDGQNSSVGKTSRAGTLPRQKLIRAEIAAQDSTQSRLLRGFCVRESARRMSAIHPG